MEYRDDLFQTLISGLSRQERSELLTAIDRNTRQVLREKRNSVGSRSGRRQRSTLQSKEASA